MRLFEFLSSQPWAITPDYAKRMVEIYDLALERKARGEDLDKQALEKQLGRPLDNSRSVTVRQGVATIPVEGPLFRRADMFTEISGATTIDTLRKDFEAALSDPAISAIILEMDSPGGEVNGTNELADAIYTARGTKPIVAYIGHSGASAAYWIASAADEVVLDATASVGSIGVIAAMRDPTKANSKDITFVSSQSPNKKPDPTTESGKSQIQTIVDDLAQVFVDTVARNRNVSSETVVKDFGAGGILVGQKAVIAGLADRVGSYEQVLSELASGYVPKKKHSNGEKTMAKDDNTLTAPSRWDQFKAMFGEEANVAPQPQGESAEVKELRAKAAQADKYAEQIKAARTSAATSFAGELITSRRVLPAAKDKIEAAYLQAAEDDELSPLAAGSRVEKLKASFVDLPAHNLTTEQMKAGLPEGAVVLNPDQGTAGDKIISEARAGAAAWQKSQQPTRIQEAH